MHGGFRAAMTWLHTWAGLVLGGVLFAVFWTGTLSVFHEEIDRWMLPSTRLTQTDAPLSLDSAVVPAIATFTQDATQWGISLPTPRRPHAPFFARGTDGEFTVHALDPATGTPLPPTQSEAASGFIVPFHYSLHIEWKDLGNWIVGLASMTMLALLVSGVVIHRKRFREFFTLRPHRNRQRFNLDLHNLTGMVALPFHTVITLSGLILFFGVYFPGAAELVYRGSPSPQGAFIGDAYGGYHRPAAGTSGEQGSLDAMLAVARDSWSGSPARFVRVWHPGDANSYVEIRRGYGDQVGLTRDQIYFDAATGEILHAFSAAPVMHVQRFIGGMHYIDFNHWTLRWLYFLGGLAGCAMIATGFVFWLQARQRRLAVHGHAGRRTVAGLAVGSVTGIIVATLALLVANRALPAQAELIGMERERLEILCFFAVWAASFVHGWLRPEAAWREQCGVIVTGALLAVALNAITTGDHLLRTVATGYWPVAGMDLLLVAGAAVAADAFRRLRPRQVASHAGTPSREHA